MSEHAREFLEQWKSDHIESVTPGRRCQEAVRLVAMCREDATKAGIPAHELRSAAPDGMIWTMLAALDAASLLKVRAEPQFPQNTSSPSISPVVQVDREGTFALLDLRTSCGDASL